MNNLRYIYGKLCILLCFFMCLTKLPFWVNLGSHRLHLNGFSPVCIRAWSKKFQAFVNSFLQWSYPHMMYLFLLLGPLLGSYLNEYLWFSKIGRDSGISQIWQCFADSKFEPCSIFIWFAWKLTPRGVKLLFMAI